MLPIEIEGLSKVYKDKWGRNVSALNELDLKVCQGEVFGFLGPNGAGKSTTIKSLVGLIRATTGRVNIFGSSATNIMCRKRIGYLPENPAFYDFLSSRQYLNLVGNCFGMNKTLIVSKSDEVLSLLDLVHAGNRPIRSYSKGMVQRLGLAQALLHDPDLFIFDEPMSGLDPLGRALVKEIMKSLKAKGKTIFFSTHVTADVEAVCDRVAVIVNGRLQTVNDVQEILEQGIEGYVVQVAGCVVADFSNFEPAELPGGLLEVYVPRNELNAFMRKVDQSKGNIRLIEPRRRDLEKFFLDIVEREVR